MYIQNRRDSSKFKGCSPLQLHLGLISLKSAIAYFAYTKRSPDIAFGSSGERTEDYILHSTPRLTATS
jgi:hypothetical protein